MLKKGPELKMPELKVPGFLLDIYYDLRERHLLPLVAILLVALVALPLALRGGSSEPEAVNPEAATAGISSSVPSSNLVVAKAAPGLRDYRRRLEDRSPRDPFVQQFTGSTEDGAAVGRATEGAAPGSPEASPGTVSTPSAEPDTTEPSSPAAPSEGDEELEGTGKLTYYSFAIDVRVIPVTGGDEAKKPKPTVRRDLPELTMLPSRETPALTFMAVSKDEKKVLMLVNDNVRGLFGDGICVVGTDSCQLLALEPGIPETVVYGADERTYRIELIKLHAVKTESLNKAPLGKEKQRESKASRKPASR